MTGAIAGPVLVDSSAWICFFARRGYPEIKARLGSLLDDDRVAITGPIVLELLQGCRSEAERVKLEALFLGLHWLRVEDRHWHEAGKIAFGLRRLGLTIGTVDILIATIARDHGSPLLHRDSDFTQIAQHIELRILVL
jgi:predicted nucleic acid-binding protein